MDQNLDLQVVDLARELLFTALVIAAPLLLIGMVVGIAVSLFQALTSVQVQTMSMVPKMFAVILVSLMLMAPALGVLKDYCLSVLLQLNAFGLS